LSADKAAAVTARILASRYLENYAFLLLYCIGQNAQHGMGIIMVSVLREWKHFS